MPSRWSDQRLLVVLGFARIQRLAAGFKTLAGHVSRLPPLGFRKKNRLGAYNLTAATGFAPNNDVVFTIVLSTAAGRYPKGSAKHRRVVPPTPTEPEMVSARSGVMPNASSV